MTDGQIERKYYRMTARPEPSPAKKRPESSGDEEQQRRERNLALCLPPDYQDRPEVPWFDDASHTRQLYYQRRTYALAKDLAVKEGLTTILDWGCGTAAKLKKEFGINAAGGPFLVTGVDQPIMIDWLRRNHSSWGRWISWVEYHDEPPVDLVICSDVVEHVSHPAWMLTKLRDLRARFYVFSTPDRDLLRNPSGPPRNRHHAREWTHVEFRSLLAKSGFRWQATTMDLEQSSQIHIATAA
jgi:hypothetical protein